MHGSLLGWLIGNDCTIVAFSEAVANEPHRSDFFAFDSDIDELLRSTFVRSTMIWTHGPPFWLRFFADVQVDLPDAWQSASPPLCDSSRHERTGVLLI